MRARDHARAGARTGARARSRRGFALPLVILLALVAALSGALLLELQTNAGSAVNRQAQVYKDHHLAGGIRELLDQWLLTGGGGGGGLADRLEEDGLAFQLDMPGNVNVRVYLDDAQGTVLRELSTIDGPQAERLERVIDWLRSNAAPLPDGTPAPVFRVYGPAAVSVNSASDDVLEAIAAASGNPDGARSLIRSIRSAVRPGAMMTKEDLASAFAEADLTPTHRQHLQAMLTAEPVLWRLTVETRHGSLSTARVERTSALITVPAAGQNPGASGVVVLSWEDAGDQIRP